MANKVFDPAVFQNQAGPVGQKVFQMEDDFGGGTKRQWRRGQSWHRSASAVLASVLSYLSGTLR